MPSWSTIHAIVQSLSGLLRAAAEDPVAAPQDLTPPNLTRTSKQRPSLSRGRSSPMRPASADEGRDLADADG